MINKMFHKPTKWSVMKQLILKDIEDLVINSLGIIAFVSFFIGGVITIQTALNMENPLLTKLFSWFCHKTIYCFRIRTNNYFYNYGR